MARVGHGKGVVDGVEVVMAWINAWQRADAINATNEIVGANASVDEYIRVLAILERAFGRESEGHKESERFHAQRESDAK